MLEQTNKQTKYSNDMSSIRSGNEVSQTDRYSNDPVSKGLERNGNILFKCRNCPATIRRSRDGKFLSVKDMFVEDLGKDIANTILARYYKGLEAESSNCVIVKYERAE